MLYQAIQTVYDRTIRPRLPRKYGVFAGVTARDQPLLDRTDRHPEYKKGLIDAIHEVVEPGDRAVLVGAGRGVSAVHLADAGASVVAFEAAAEMLDIAEETVELAGVGEAVEFRHALVGDDIEVYGDLEGADRVPPASLSTGDVLVLDCEGAERSILAGLTEWPGRTIVESHPERGVPPEAVTERLTEQGYQVATREYEPGASPEKQVVVASENTGEAE